MAVPALDALASQAWVMLLFAAVRTPLRLVGATADDAALLDAVARGDAKVAVGLYDRLRPVVSRTVRRVAPRVTDHEDMVQQAFVELVVALRQRPTVRDLDAWAATIAARVAWQRLRRAHLEARFAEVDADVFEQAGVHPAQALVDRDALRALARCLAGLNAARLQVFVLHDVHGFELKEIAGILDVSVANAQSRLVRGRGDVRRVVEADPALRDLLTREGAP